MATYIKPDAIKDNSLSIDKIDNVALDLADKVNALSDEGKNTFLNKIGLGKIGVISQKQNWTPDYSSYTVSNVVRGIIPQSFIDMALSIGATFNDTDETINHTTSWGEVVPNPPGYFYFIGVGDLSYKEMLDTYNCNAEGNQGDGAYMNTAEFITEKVVRAVSPIRLIMNSTRIDRFALNGKYIENIILHHNYENVAFLSAYSSFSNCRRLRTIISSNIQKRIVSKATIPSATGNMFQKCYSLKTVYLAQLNYSIQFSDSSRLSNESILYMIQNEAAASAITFTLHPDAYARAMADADILAALEQHTKISLASV